MMASKRPLTLSRNNAPSAKSHVPPQGLRWRFKLPNVMMNIMTTPDCPSKLEIAARAQMAILETVPRMLNQHVRGDIPIVAAELQKEEDAKPTPTKGFDCTSKATGLFKQLLSRQSLTLLSLLASQENVMEEIHADLAVSDKILQSDLGAAFTLNRSRLGKMFHKGSHEWRETAEEYTEKYDKQARKVVKAALYFQLLEENQLGDTRTKWLTLSERGRVLMENMQAYITGVEEIAIPAMNIVQEVRTGTGL